MYVSNEVKDVSNGCYLDALSPYGRNEEGFPYAVVNVEWPTARNCVTTILGYYPTKERALRLKALLEEEMDKYPSKFPDVIDYFEVWHLTDNEKSGE